MISVLIIINVILLVSISILHFYWAIGGTWGLLGAIPERLIMRNNIRLNKITDSSVMIILTIIVALGLLVFASIIALNSTAIKIPMNPSWVKTGTIIIGIIFLLRAIGNFDFVGLFKSDHEGVFAERDTKFYVPLCLVLAINSFLIILL